MNKGDIVLYTTNNRADIATKLVEWAVKKSTQGPFVHCEILLEDNKTIGASIDGVHYRTLPQKGYTIFPIEVTNKAAQEHALATVEKLEGKSYGWLDILDVAIGGIWKNGPIKIALLSGNNFDCSDLVAWYLTLCGIDVPWPYPYIVSPNDIARFLSGHK